MTSQTSWIIGSGADCDIVVDDPRISGKHCQLTQTPQGYQLVDLGSTNGTFVNGLRLSGPALVSAQDAVTLGRAIALPWPQSPVPRAAAPRRTAPEGVQPPAGIQTAAPQGPPSQSHSKQGAAKPSQGKQVVLGRDATCDYVLDSTRVSRRHAAMRRAGGQWIVEDLGSANGTFVNGRLIEGPVPLYAGDEICIGDFKLELTPEGQLRKREVHGQLTIEARGISIEVPGRRLLDHVSLIIYPGEFVGLMGPSGAGKTTLMNVLNGYTPPTDGLVLFNGQDLYADYTKFAGLVGYVPQDDIMHRELTVGQALYYTARLRLPAETSDQEIQARIESVLKQLGLEGTINTLIGSPERKGISGGQRKRVNLAMELLTDPAVLFLDEPTSGLSSEDALTVMTLLRQLADSGKSILLTIHQPSREAYRLMDNVVIIAEDPQGTDPGRLAYYGPAYPDAIQFFNRSQRVAGELSPEELLRGLAQRPTDEWCELYRASQYQREFIDARAGMAAAGADAVAPRPMARVSMARQWATLVRRSLTIKGSDRWNTSILLAQAPVVAAAVVLVFGNEASKKITIESWQQVNGATAVTVFLLGLSALWFGCSNAVREIVGEWAIYQRERMVNLRIAPYVFSKLTVSGALCLAQCAVLVSVARWGCSLRAPLFSSFLVMMLIALTGVGIGLILSSVARTSEVAIALLPLTLIPMVIFGGILLPVHKMKAPIKVIAYAMPSRSGFEAMMLQEAGRKPLGPSPYSGMIAVDSLAKDPDRPDMAEAYFPRNHRVGTAASVEILAVMFFATVISIHLILRARDVR